MAIYDYYCDKCGLTEEFVHGMMEKPEIICSECKSIMEKIISSNFGGFILKGGTPAIHYREKLNRHKHIEEMTQRQRERYGESARIKPNIAGIETGSWNNAYTIAQEIKKETGIIPETYAELAIKEKKV